MKMKSARMNEMSNRMKKDKEKRWKIRRCKERKKNLAQKESKDGKCERGWRGFKGCTKEKDGLGVAGEGTKELEMKGDEGLFECNRNWDRG